MYPEIKQQIGLTDFETNVKKPCLAKTTWTKNFEGIHRLTLNKPTFSS